MTSHYCLEEIKTGQRAAVKALTKLRKRIEDKNISYEELAKQLGVTEHYVKSELNGNYISIKAFATYAAMVGLKVNISLGG